jgi:hypothetical protein
VLAVAYDYYGGAEGMTQIVWYRTPGAAASAPLEVGRGRTYSTSVADIGGSLRVVITPVRADGMPGDAVTVSLAEPVAAAQPQVLSFGMPHVAQEGVSLRPQGSYFGPYSLPPPLFHHLAHTAQAVTRAGTASSGCGKAPAASASSSAPSATTRPTSPTSAAPCASSGTPCAVTAWWAKLSWARPSRCCLACRSWCLCAMRQWPHERRRP